jgi:hypothetical protein
LPPLPIVDVDPWSEWPFIDALPIPAQAAQIVEAAGAAPVEVPVVGSLPPEDGAPAVPVELLALALLSAAAGALGGTRRGRLLVAAAWLGARRAASARWPIGGTLPAGAARLVLGRLWIIERDSH